MKSLRLANALCHLHAFFCVHCAWLGRNLLCYPSPSLLLLSKAANPIKSEVQGVQSLGQGKENKLREAAGVSAHTAWVKREMESDRAQEKGLGERKNPPRAEGDV